MLYVLGAQPHDLSPEDLEALKKNLCLMRSRSSTTVFAAALLLCVGEAYKLR